MRDHSKLFVAALVVSVQLLFAACSGSQSSEGKSQITRNEEGQILAPTERSWVTNKIGKEISLQPGITDSLLQPMSIEWFDGQLYVSDFGDMKIKKFTAEGQYLDSFGKKGRGPGEFQMLVDYDISGDTLYVIDPRQGMLMKFDAASTRHLTSHDMKSRPYRMAVIGEQFVIESGMGEHLFTVTDTRLNVKRQFGQFIDDQQQNGISVMGNIQAIRDTGFVFAPSMASYLYYFDQDGNRTESIRTPDQIPFQEPNVRKSGDRRVITPPDTKVRTGRLATVGNKLYVFQSYTKDDEALPASFMDVYQLGSGQYLHSVEFPFAVRNGIFGEEALYLIDSETAVVKAFEYAG